MTQAATDTLKMALQYASLGLRVFPILGKNAPPQNWPSLATSDETALIELFERHRALKDVAVKCGPESKLVDINVNGPAGKELFAELFGGKPPITPQYLSTRGPHWWLLWRLGLPQKARYFLGPDNPLEVIAGNGNAYTLAPPSVADGFRREWLPELAPWDVPLAEIPDDVLARLGGQAPRKVKVESDAGGVIKDGERNTRLTSIAGSYRRIGWDATAIYGALAVVNRERCKNPLPDGEVRKIAESVARYDPEEIAADISDWHMKIISSDPKRYRIYSPLWPGFVSVTPSQFRRFWALADEVQEQKDIFLKSELKKEWPRIAQSMLKNAEYIEATPDEIRSAIVAAAVLDYLSEPKQVPDGGEPDLRGIASRMPGGEIVFAFRPMHEQLRRSADDVKRGELSKLFARCGVTDYRPRIGGKRSRFQVADEAALDRLREESEARSANPFI